MPDREELAPPAAATPAHDVRGALTFIVPQETKPYFESAALTGGEPRVHFRTEVRRVDVRDMRRVSDLLSLDRHGFLLVRHETAVDDLYDDEAVAGVYDRELEALLAEVTGADRVAVFDHTRRSDGTGGAANPDGFRGPASRVHVDYTVDSGPKRAADALGREALDRVLSSGGRIVQVNVWRPIRGPVLRTPIALADAGSVRPDELIATDQVFPDRVGEIYQLHPAPARARRGAALVLGAEDGARRGAAHQGLGQPRRRPRPLHPARRVPARGPGPGGAAAREHRGAHLPRVRRLKSLVRKEGVRAAVFVFGMAASRPRRSA